MSKKCDELNCLANDGQGFCRIDTCSLIDPERAIIEFSNLTLDERDLENVKNWMQRGRDIID